jgi:hypothetical protein
MSRKKGEERRKTLGPNKMAVGGLNGKPTVLDANDEMH